MSRCWIFFLQINSLKTKLKTLQKECEARLKDRELAENQYISEVTALGLRTANEARLDIEKARESPQEAKLLQAIHLAHTVVVENGKNIKSTEQQLAALHEASNEYHINIASLRAVLEQKVNEVPARLSVRIVLAPPERKTHNVFLLLL